MSSTFLPYMSTLLLRFTLNTCVDPPHQQKVTSLTFQPHERNSVILGSRSKTVESSRPYTLMAVSTSWDGSFKTWVLVDSERQSGGRTRVHSSWACHSMGDFHGLPCLGSAFSQDGTVLALNFQKVSFACSGRL